MNKRVITALGAIFCCALWGISTPIVKMGYAYADASHVPSLLLWAGIQFIFAGILTIGTYSIVSKKIMCPKKESMKGISLVALFQTVLQYAFLYIGLLHTTSMKGAILKSTDVFFVALMASLLFKMEKLTARKLISCMVGFAGIIIMNLNGLSFNMNLLGDGVVLLAIVCYSLSVIMTKLFTREEDPVVLSGYQMSLGGVTMLLIGIIFGGEIMFINMLPIIVCLAVIYAVSYSLWTILLKNNQASSVTIYSFMTPVFGVIFSVLLLNEEGGVAPPNLLVALILVCMGILLWGTQKE